MSKDVRLTLKSVMTLAWQFVKKNGYTMSEALKCAWNNIKLRAALPQRIVKFYFTKVDGSLREAYGTLDPHRTPDVVEGNRKKCDTVQVYFDTEKDEWRCYKKANLMRVCF